MSEPTVTVDGAEVRILEHQGQRVVTLAMIDELHQRPEGTAGRTFRANRERLKNGVHYWEISPDEIRRVNPGLIGKSVNVAVVLLSERGYLMLVKSFTDDRAWRVQDMLVESYFRVRELAAKPSSSLPIAAPSAPLTPPTTTLPAPLTLALIAGPQLPDFRDPAAAAKAWVQEHNRATAAEQRCEELARRLGQPRAGYTLEQAVKLLRTHEAKLLGALEEAKLLRRNGDPTTAAANTGYFVQVGAGEHVLTEAGLRFIAKRLALADLAEAKTWALEC